MELYQGCTQITHQCPTRQQQHQAPNPRVQTQKRKPGSPLRVDPIEVYVETTYQIKPVIPPIVNPSEVSIETQEKIKPV